MKRTSFVDSATSLALSSKPFGGTTPMTWELDNLVTRLVEGDEAFRLKRQNEMLEGALGGSCTAHDLLIANDRAREEAARRFRESRSEEANQLLSEILRLKAELERKVERYREIVQVA